ncbi:hypothetical protein ACP70R_032762 [Stipagrostis hirtigluma subsp. patula]
MDAMLRSPMLDKLQELEIYVYETAALPLPPYLWLQPQESESHGDALLQLPPSVLRFSPTLRVLTLCSGLSFPEEAAADALRFPRLKKLTLMDIEISEGALNGVLSGCLVLDSLLLDGCIGCRRLRISSVTLRSLGVSSGVKGTDGKLEELIVDDAPLLERLIPRCPNYGLLIRVIKAPKLKTLGYLHDDIPTFEVGTLHLEKMVPVTLSNVLCSVKILALLTNPDLDLVTGLLKCFPCVEKLYIVSYPRLILKNSESFAPLECLDQHLKMLQITNYEGKEPDINFIKFFVLNARQLECMKFIVRREKCGAKWIARQHVNLQVNDRASPGARFHFEASPCSSSTLVHMKHIHDLAMDPFDGSLCKCHDDEFV